MQHRDGKGKAEEIAQEPVVEDSIRQLETANAKRLFLLEQYAYLFDEDTGTFKTWQESKPVQTRLRRIGKAREHFAIIDQANMLMPEEKKLLRDVIQSTIDIDLLTLELAQRSALSKAYEINNPEISGLNKSLNVALANKEKLRMRLQSYLAYHPDLRTFLMNQNESTFKDATLVADLAAKTADMATTATGVVTAVSKVSSAVGNLLQALPIVSNVASAVAYIIKAVKNIVRDKSPQKKVAGVVIAALFVGGAIAAGVVAVATGAITAGLIGLGVVIDYARPIVKYSRRIKQKEKELAKAEERIAYFETGKGELILDNNDKNELFQHLQKGVQHDFHQEIDTIKEGRLHEIQRFVPGNDLPGFLSTKAQARRHRLIDEIAELKAKRWDRAIKTVNGAVAVVGAVLCLFPPTLLIGAVLLAASAAASLILKKINIVGRIKNAILKKINKEKQPVQVKAEVVDEHPEKLKQKHELVHEKAPPIHESEIDIARRLSKDPRKVLEPLTHQAVEKPAEPVENHNDIYKEWANRSREALEESEKKEAKKSETPKPGGHHTDE